VKITLELDPASLQKAAAAEADKPTSAKNAVEVPAKAEAESAAPAKQPQPPAPRAAKETAEPKKSEEKPTPLAASSGNFAHQGGITVVHDPDKNNPNVFRFSYTEEK